uniref:Uncharacterized protein n=1 Tax=Pithovirus LCPAC406 TaxID=2506599 RepID=A0A481ZDI4_9VIRU|nr:MAG: hypothetical protein LCPAC406_03370 [Pithovirus LCPAC406]
MIIKQIKDKSYVMMQPEKKCLEKLVSSFLFALYPPYRRGFKNGKKTSKAQISSQTLDEINLNYPSKLNVAKERIVSIASYFDCNVCVKDVVYIPYSGIAERTIIVSVEYDLLIKEIKGIQTCYFTDIRF